jgi:hypothetical protein
MSKTNGSNVPVQTLRSRRIKAAIWKNQTAKGVFYTVTITRSFKKDEQWHDSHSFSQDELLIVAKLMYDAHTAISALLAAAKESKRTAPSAAPPPVRGRAKV